MNCFGEHRVVFGGGEEPVEVGVDDPTRHWPRTLDLGQGQIGAYPEPPGDVDRLGRGTEEFVEPLTRVTAQGLS
jgi:hypothetical protein